MRTTIRRASRLLGAVLAGLVLCLMWEVFTAGRAEATTPTITCGSGVAGSAGQANIQADQSVTTIDLGRASGGRGTSPYIGFKVVRGSCVLPSSIPVSLGVLNGSGSNLGLPVSVPTCNTKVVPFCAIVSVDGNNISVILAVERNLVPPGSYSGELQIGNNAIGESEEHIVVNRPQAWQWPALLGFLAVAGGVAFAGLRELIVGNREAKADAAAKGTKLGDVRLRTRANTRFKKTLMPVNFLAAAVGLGAGAGAWVEAYVNSQSWQFNIGTGFSLISKVGGAAATAAFVVWTASATQK